MVNALVQISINSEDNVIFLSDVQPLNAYEYIIVIVLGITIYFKLIQF